MLFWFRNKKIYITNIPYITYILSAFAFEIKISKANITNIPNITIIPCSSDLEI